VGNYGWLWFPRGLTPEIPRKMTSRFQTLVLLSLWAMEARWMPYFHPFPQL